MRRYFFKYLLVIFFSLFLLHQLYSKTPQLHPSLSPGTALIFSNKSLQVEDPSLFVFKKTNYSIRSVETIFKITTNEGHIGSFMLGFHYTNRLNIGFSISNKYLKCTSKHRDKKEQYKFPITSKQIKILIRYNSTSTTVYVDKNEKKIRHYKIDPNLFLYNLNTNVIQKKLYIYVNETKKPFIEPFKNSLTYFFQVLTTHQRKGGSLIADGPTDEGIFGP